MTTNTKTAPQETRTPTTMTMPMMITVLLSLLSLLSPAHIQTPRCFRAVAQAGSTLSREPPRQKQNIKTHDTPEDGAHGRQPERRQNNGLAPNNARKKA